MGLIYLPAQRIPGNFKPDIPIEVNTENYLSNSATSIFPFQAIGQVGVVSAITAAHELISNQIISGAQTFNVDTGYVSSSVGTCFQVYNNYGNNYCYINFTSPHTTPAPYSYFIEFSIPPGGQSGCVIQMYQEGGNYPCTGSLQFTAPNQLSILVTDSGGTTHTSTPITLNNNQIYQAVISVGAISASLTVNGVGTESISYSALSTNPLTAFIGSGVSGGNSGTFAYSFLAVFSRQITTAEQDSLFAKPYQLIRPIQKNLFFAVSSGSGFAQAVSSTLTLGGTYGRAIARAVVASATPQGTSTKDTARTLSASATAQGLTNRATARTIAGSIASTGTETEQAGIGMLVTGTITAGATLARAFSRTITGVVSFAGTVLRNTGRAVVASIASTGTETEQAGIGLAVAGSITLAAIVSTARQFTLALSAAIAFGGAVARGTGRAVSGAVSATANASRATGRTLAGVLTATGAVLQNLGTSLAVAGSIAVGAVVSAVKGIATLTRSILTLLGVGN